MSGRVDILDVDGRSLGRRTDVGVRWYLLRCDVCGWSDRSTMRDVAHDRARRHRCPAGEARRADSFPESR